MVTSRLALLVVHTSGYQIPALPVTNCVALGKLLTSWDDGFLMERVRIEGHVPLVL